MIRHGVAWQEPFHWWGPPWSAPNPVSLDQLVAGGTLSAAEAEWLARHVAEGGSLLVAAGPSGAGKSTLAAALAAIVPDSRQKTYLRGEYESFEWIAESASTLTILVNEISDHLPVYAWGSVARAVFQLVEAGAQVIATAHASNDVELIRQFGGEPVRATWPQIATLDVVVFLSMRPTTTGIDRRVDGICRWSRGSRSGPPQLAPVEI